MTPTALPNSPRILPLDSLQATLVLAGGKGANLARLRQGGFPLPDGFLVTTCAYQDFVHLNLLEDQILSLLSEVDSGRPETLEYVSAKIRALFSVGKISVEFSDQLQSAYQELGKGAVAVRSSATAEDLPELSFAGQQETYLNVLGDQRLQQAVVDCWSSLWTGRAIGYRLRNHINQAEVTLAVVVQSMVQSEASGVLFTANPLSGLRSEMVIDATLGLGEALVSGQVEPDHYVVDLAGGRILSKTLGAKIISIHGKSTGGTQVTEQRRGDVQALPDEQILELAQLGSQAAEMFGFPQDIEWAWAEKKLTLLQARPITALFPLPEGVPAEPLKTWISLGAVQGMLDPLTPIGRYALRLIFAAAAELFGERVTPETQTALYEAGERLWINFTPIMSNSFGRRVVPVVLGLVEPTVRQAVGKIQDDPRLLPTRPGISLHGRLRLARFFIPVGANLFLNLLSPRQRREMIVQKGERLIALLESRCAAVKGDRWQKLTQQADLLPDLDYERFAHIFLLFVSGVASGMASWNFLNILTAEAGGQKPGTRDLVLRVTRGMPYNPTTEMDLLLWELAKIIRSDPASWQVFKNSQATELTRLYRAGCLPQISSQAVSRFLAKYGGRGLGEIDLGRPRWAEDPTHVFEMLSSFLQIEDESLAPDVVFARGAKSAQQTVDQLATMVRKTKHGWLKARLLRFFAGRARQLMGARESPKFFVVRMMWLIQRELLKTGEEFVQAGELVRADDLFYLTLAELKQFAVQRDGHWSELISTRRESYRRELMRRQIPRLLLSDGRAFYEGISSPEAGADTINGSPVSPGSAQGYVRVVLDPRQANLQPGEILVCPGTDPSWTPLFFSAAGLVMETGGMMTHGAVVAREYGIPAIVGVDKATQRLHTGQFIRMDGSTGVIELNHSNVTQVGL
jgi:phosphohistidine swiveling domain-containing protein